MQNERKISKLVGWLFIAASVSAVSSAILLGSVMSEPDLLARIAENKTGVILSALMQIVLVVSVVAIPVVLYPILEKHNNMVARGYLVSRIIEVVPFFLGITSMLLLIAMGQNGSNEVAESISHTGELTAIIGGQILFSLTALILNYSFYITKLIPRWLSIWGLIGVPLMLASGVWGLFTFGEIPIATNTLIVPLALQEMVMAIWLIAKGFNPAK